MSHIDAFKILGHGGAWLGAGRTALQSSSINGDRVEWGSQTTIQGLSVRDFEYALAAAVAADRKQHVGVLEQALRTIDKLRIAMNELAVFSDHELRIKQKDGIREEITNARLAALHTEGRIKKYIGDLGSS